MADDGRFLCVFHYGGYFINKTTLDYVGKYSEWNCDPDKWSYWEILDILKGKGVHPDHIIGMWYNDPTKELGLGLREIKDDKGAFGMIEIANNNGSVDVYVDNGPNYVLRPPNLEEVDDNGHCEIIRESSVVGLDNENDVHSEIFGQGYYSEKDDKCDDSVREVVFDDSEEESDANGGFPLLEDAPQSPPPINYARERNADSTSTVQGKKNTKKGKESTEKDKGKKPVIRKKGRPKKDKGKKPQHEYFSDHSDDVSLYDERDVAKEMKQNKVARELRREPGMLNKKGMKQGCRRCGEPGHNKSTCKLPPPPPPPPTPAATTTATAPANTSVIAPTNAAPTPPAIAPATTPVIAPTNASGAVAATRKSPRNRDEVPATQPAMPTRKLPRNREELPATQPAVPTTKSPVKRKRVEAATQPAPATRKSPIKRNKTDQTATPKNQGKKPTKTPPKAPPNAPPKAPFKPPRSSQKPPFKP
ncbi:hypothetical protein QL285_094882 [Trifolium repens]|nr:hypothetical protein QL285_094882 [Trifolium repens]